MRRTPTAIRMPIALIGLTLLFISCVTVSRAQSRSNTLKPNILMIVADDHGTDALGCYGNNVIKTPSMDALAADGKRYTNAFCTTASCSPSRSVILTGIHNHANGMYGLEHLHHHFSSLNGIKSLPIYLAEGGYRTARIGKFHIAPESVYSFQQVLSAGGANNPESLGRNPVQMAKMSAGFLSAKDQRPFFLYFASDDPHRSNRVKPDGSPDFGTYPTPNSFGNRKEGYPGVKEVLYDPLNVNVPRFLPDSPECRAELAQYYQAVSRLDQGIGELVSILKAAGHYDDTLILYLSDNGVAFPGAKTTLYDAGMRLPLIIKEPGAHARGEVVDEMVSWSDLTPTILDYAGLAIDETRVQGRSFRRSAAEEVYASHTFHEITMYYPMRVVRTARYKLIHNLAHQLPFPMALDLSQSPTWISFSRSGASLYGRRSLNAFLHRPEYELYDLEKDPDEVRNLATDPKSREVFESLKERLRSFQIRTRDPWIE